MYLDQIDPKSVLYIGRWDGERRPDARGLNFEHCVVVTREVNGHSVWFNTPDGLAHLGYYHVREDAIEEAVQRALRHRSEEA